MTTFEIQFETQDGGWEYLGNYEYGTFGEAERDITQYYMLYIDGDARENEEYSSGTYRIVTRKGGEEIEFSKTYSH